jgi:hypothetical protein
MRTFVLVAALLAVPLAAAASTAPKSAVFNDTATGQTCGPGGQPNAADPVENMLKNRVAMPASTTATTVAEFRNLPNHDKAARSAWTPEDLATFKALEDVPVRIVGYLKGVKSEGAEATNCKFTDAAGVDFHSWLVDAADKDQDRSFSAVAEFTPRWRQSNPAWTLAALQKLVTDGAQVRISGWRLFDYEHPEQLPANNAKNPTRSTLWEIHPITMVEVATQAGWVELGAATTPAARTLLRARPLKKPPVTTETNTGEQP